MLLSSLKKIGLFEIIRDASFATCGFISDPQKDMLTFFESIRHQDVLVSLKEVSCVITTKELAERLKHVKGIAVAKNPRLEFYKIHNHLAKEKFYWKDFPTQIAKETKVHPHASIAKKNVRIGPNTVIEANVVVLERCLIGKGVHIMPGVVLGSFGLQVSRFEDGIMDMVHAGGIKVNDHVHIMSNSVVACAVFRELTTIGEGSRIGNLAFISHNVQMGRRCFVGHGSVINGNVKIGQDVWIGPGAILSNNITIGDKAQVCLGSTVIKDVASGQSVIGCVAIEKRKMLNHITSIGRDEMPEKLPHQLANR